MCGYASFVAIFYMWFKCCLYSSTDFVPMVSEDRQLLGMPGRIDFSTGSNTIRNPVSDWNWLGQRELGGMPFIPQMKGFFYFTLLVSWESFFWPLYSLGINPTALGALEPDWIVSSVYILSSLSQFQRTYQKSETWILKRSLTTPAHHIISLPAKWCPGTQGATRIIIFESSHPVKILKSSWE